MNNLTVRQIDYDGFAEPLTRVEKILKDAERTVKRLKDDSGVTIHIGLSFGPFFNDQGDPRGYHIPVRNEGDRTKVATEGVDLEDREQERGAMLHHGQS